MSRIQILNGITEASAWSGETVAEAIEAARANGWTAEEYFAAPMVAGDSEAEAAADAVQAYLEAAAQRRDTARVSAVSLPTYPTLHHEAFNRLVAAARAWRSGKALPLRCPETGRQVRRVTVVTGYSEGWHGIVPGAGNANDDAGGRWRTEERYWIAPGVEAPPVCVLIGGDKEYPQPPVRLSWHPSASDFRCAVDQQALPTSDWLPRPPRKPLYVSELDAADAWDTADRLRKEEAARRAEERRKQREREEWEAASVNSFAALKNLLKEAS